MYGELKATKQSFQERIRTAGDDEVKGLICHDVERLSGYCDETVQDVTGLGTE